MRTEKAIFYNEFTTWAVVAFISFSTGWIFG